MISTIPVVFDVQISICHFSIPKVIAILLLFRKGAVDASGSEIALTLPDGKKLTAIGSNYKQAKEIVSERALRYMDKKVDGL